MRGKTAAVTSTAALLLTVPVAAVQAEPTAPATTTPAPAAPAADHAAATVDLAASLVAAPASVAPGGFFKLRVGGKIVSGSVDQLNVTVTLPAGVTYAESDSAIACRPGADRRSFTCPAQPPMPSGSLGLPVTLRVDEDVAVGTDLNVTGTVTPVGATDDEPANDTATTTVRTAPGADLDVTWKPGSASLRTGEVRTAELVVTNNGPGPAPAVVIAVHVGYDHPVSTSDKRCWWDPGTAVCEEYTALAPGRSVTFPFTFTYDRAAAGTTYKVSASLYADTAKDSVRENNQDEIAVTYLAGGKPKPTDGPTTKPTSTPTARPTAPASTTSAPQSSHTGRGTGGDLADTGSGPLPALAGTAAALAAAGGVLFVRARRRAGNGIRRRH
ncbi:hypothetical protein [Streptomyces roseoviridis]|uniref:DUF11 domain-containing protein n=1 Tax=Streptomyces roseoviridis TaxID=67361 RepID=A0ABV5QJS1_9ACTN